MHAAALAGLLDEAAPGEGSNSRSGPIVRVLHHERRYWRRTTAVYDLPAPDRSRLDSVVTSAIIMEMRGLYS